jgi:predicted RNA-binding protein with PIN domain
MGQAGAVHYVVDGMNLIGSRPDGWWRDRAGARRRLVDELAAWGTAQAEAELTVVFDGRPKGDEIEDAAARHVSARFAPGGPNAADDAIVEFVGGLPEPGGVTVVTSDAALVERVRTLGAVVEGVGAFRRRLSA